ncbi:hypothetical protein CTI12_AA053040 [Artemisia annua]|uniref:Uncharacterized protein n=1 Tax=Artemisia annua TaxID=35608 RepID=A0A2U1QAT6_ARTAN|nr:hypothetical protein CTI12_AA053040 [Artemisia annua]
MAGGFPSFAVSGEGDKGEGPNMFYPQPPSVISNLNSLFLFTSTMRATTSSPLLNLGGLALRASRRLFFIERESGGGTEDWSAPQSLAFRFPPPMRGAHSLPLNDEAGSGRRDLNPQPQPWQGYALPIKLFPPATVVAKHY